MRFVLRATSLAFLMLVGTRPAPADSLTANLSGSFGPTTTLGGIALGADTAFTLKAVSDTSSGFTVVPGLDVYAVTRLTIEIAGRGAFVGIPDADANIFLADRNLDPSYQLGLVNSGISSGFGGVFLAATPDFRADAPTSSVLSNFDHATVNAPYHIALVGVAGGLVVKDMASDPQAASIVVSVPEPTSLIALAIGVAILASYDAKGKVSGTVFPMNQP